MKEYFGARYFWKVLTFFIFILFSLFFFHLKILRKNRESSPGFILCRLRLSFSLVMCLQQARGTNRRHQSLIERRVDIRNQESLIRGGSALRSNHILFYIPFLDKIKNPSGIYTLYFPSTNGTPFAYLFQNTASLLAVVSALFFLFPKA